MRERHFAEYTNAGVERICEHCHFYGHDSKACASLVIGDAQNARHQKSDGAIDPRAAQSCNGFIANFAESERVANDRRQAEFIATYYWMTPRNPLPHNLDPLPELIDRSDD